MKRKRIIDLLTDPESGMERTYHHLSYAIFRTVHDFGRILAARFPVGAWLHPGCVLQTDLALSDEAVAYLLRNDRTEPPLFVLSDVGLGLLSKRYDAVAGLGLYLHIHCRPEAGARLLCAGALGRCSKAFRLSERVRAQNGPLRTEDAASFSALLDAWQAVCVGQAGLLVPDSRDRICLTTLGDAILRMADFAGCDIRLEGFPEGISDRDDAADDRLVPRCCFGGGVTLPCYRPMLTEALLLYILTETRTYATTRRLNGSWRASVDGEPAVLSFRYPLNMAALSVRTRDSLEKARAYLRASAEISGLDVAFPPVPNAAYALEHTEAYPSEQSIMLEWLTDPTVLPSGDLKARLGFRRA